MAWSWLQSKMVQCKLQGELSRNEQLLADKLGTITRVMQSSDGFQSYGEGYDQMLTWWRLNPAHEATDYYSKYNNEVNEVWLAESRWMYKAEQYMKRITKERNQAFVAGVKDVWYTLQRIGKRRLIARRKLMEADGWRSEYATENSGHMVQLTKAQLYEARRIDDEAAVRKAKEAAYQQRLKDNPTQTTLQRMAAKRGDNPPKVDKQ